MSVKTKRVSVAKRPSAEQIQNAKRWENIMKNYQVEWGLLTEEWKDFFELVGNTSIDENLATFLIDKAIEKDEKK
jgi:hypothetical protein